MALLLTIPLVLAGALHMVVVKLDALSYLKKPIHQSWFGMNKTWRGIIVMPLLTILGVLVALWCERFFEITPFSEHSSLWLGLSLGIGYVIPELPNSFMKRKLGIKPGELSDRSPWLFTLIDQSDSVIGCVVIYALFGIGDLRLWIALIVLGTVVHLMINIILWMAGLRKHPM
ncbi:MAG: CDP-archaeol synthase [Bacteriovoracaceae bacterium]|nr:CDP-archaeol synthase [Bacteriovoracaceae bacterium]